MQVVSMGATMLTRMTERDWTVALEVFRATRSRRGDKGRDDRKFLEALHYFTLHNITWRALPPEFGPWNSVWKRFWRLREAGVFEAFFETLAGLSSTAHLVQNVRFHRHPRPCLGGWSKRGQAGQALGCSRAGFSTKIHLKSDFEGERGDIPRGLVEDLQVLLHSSWSGLTMILHGPVRSRGGALA